MIYEPRKQVSIHIMSEIKVTVYCKEDINRNRHDTTHIWHLTLSVKSRNLSHSKP